MTDRRNGESPVDWSPDPFPSTNHDSRDGITQNIQSHRPNRSTLDRSLSNRDRSVARARARRSSRRSSRAMTRPRRRWADTIFPKPFRSSSPRARADRIVPRRPSHDHRARRSYLPRARSPVRVVPRETSREGRRERASAREGDTIAARGGRAMDDAGRCDRRARAVTTNEKALGISYPPIVSSVASSRATTDATTDARARARPNDRGWIAIDRGSIDSGGGIGYFV